jgi:hypothetical protein
MQVLFVLLIFVLVAFLRNLHVAGSDLTPSYLACRIMVDGEQSHLYNHDPVLFNHLSDPAWTAAAVEGGIGAVSNVPPYVQTPLWAYSLEPLCTHLSYARFVKLFLFLELMCFAAVLWIIARYWAPRLFHPLWLAGICLCLYTTETFQYALALAQTHIFFFLLSVLALLLARSRHHGWAGFLLALAAAVKITPGFLLIYWLMTRRWKAALSFTISSVLLLGITVLLTSRTVTGDYFHEISATSNVLLVAFNNQSLAAWWMGHFYPRSELFVWHILRLPPVMKIASTLLSLISAAVGGLMDRDSALERTGFRPYGAAVAIVGTMIFAPIAWSHYSIVLLLPVMLLLDVNRDHRTRLAIVFALVILALNLYPLAYRAVLMHSFQPGFLHHKEVSITRSQFFAGVLSLAAMGWLFVMRREQAAEQKSMGVTTAMVG